MEIIKESIFSRRQRHEIYKKALKEYRAFPNWGCEGGICYALYRGMMSCREEGLLEGVKWPLKNPCYSLNLYPEVLLYEPANKISDWWWWPKEDRESREEVLSLLIEYTDPFDDVI